MFFPRICKRKYDRDRIDQYIRRFYNRKSIAEMAERLGMKETYIKHRIHALNIAPYKEDKIPIVNKRPYKDYVTYNYAQHFENAISYVKYSYADPDIPFSEWSTCEEGVQVLCLLLKAAGVQIFFCDYQSIKCNQKRKDRFR